MNTITATHYNPASQPTDIIDTRAVATPSGARRSLLAMIDRTCKSGGAFSQANDGDVVYARRQAAAWDGRTPITIKVAAWNAHGSVRFEAA